MAPGEAAHAHASATNTRYSGEPFDFDFQAAPLPATRANLDVENQLRADASRITAALARARDETLRLEADRRACMEQMHYAGMSWAAIGKEFGITSTAALYATGRASRQKKK